MTSCGISPFSLLLVVLTSFTSVIPSAGTPVVAQRYPISLWSNPRNCPELQLNLTMKCIVTESKIYVFSRITDNVAGNYLLLGEIDLKSAFSLAEYQFEWWTSPNFTDVVYFLAGDDSQLIFNTERRVGYGVSNKTAALVSYDPASHELDIVALPSGFWMDAIPNRGISVTVPELKMTYYIASEGEAKDISTPVVLFAYNYSDNSVVRKPMPANKWATVSYIQAAGQKSVLVMLGGIDAVQLLPLPMNKVYVYDIAADKGYLQPATGAVPSPRIWICAVVASAADNSSHQIHVYGGQRPDDTNADAIVDNYYILSLPQFIWSRAPSLPQPITISRCDRLGTHRMVITDGMRKPWTDCVALLKILDLSTGRTINTFADSVDYTVPGYVVADIGGSGAGGATVTQPASGYVDGLKAVIGATSEPPTCANGKRDDCRRGHPGAIIGGAVGAGVVVLGLVWLWLRSKRVGPEDTGAAEPVEPQMHELPDPVPELQSREEGMQSSAHELPGNMVIPDQDLRV